MPTIALDSPEVLHLRERDWRLSRLIGRMGPLDHGAPASAFHNLAHSIIEQMLSMKAAATIERRVYDLCGDDFRPETVAALSADDLRACAR